jgi:hypothetical protein
MLIPYRTLIAIPLIYWPTQLISDANRLKPGWDALEIWERMGSEHLGQK